MAINRLAEQYQREYMELLGQAKPETDDEREDGYRPPDKAKYMLINPQVRYLVDVMADEQAGILFKALFAFFEDGEQIKTKDKLILATFNTCRDGIIDNNNRYKKKCIQNHKNRKGFFDTDGKWDETLDNPC